MKITLWGYYGSNYGDDIMLKVILDYLEKESIDVILIDLYNGKLDYQIGSRYKNVEVINFSLLTKKEKIQTLKKLAKTKINIWGGGTIFTDVDGDGNFKFFSLIKMHGGKIGYVGVGIGALTVRNRLLKTKMLLSLSSLTIFRDQKSLQRAKELKHNEYYKVEDLSYIFFNDYKLKHNSEEKKRDFILVTWRNLSGYVSFEDEMKLMDHLVENIERLIKEFPFKRVILSALDANFDVESCRYLFEKLSAKQINVYFDIDSSIENITALINSAGFHFSGRLHGSVASEILNTPTLSLSYSPKMQYFYESINSTNYIDIYKEKIDFSNILSIIKNHNGSNDLDIADKVNDAKKNFNYLSGFLNKQEG